MKIFSVYDKEFKSYGKVLNSYDYDELFEELQRLETIENGILYEASVKTLEETKIFEEFKNRGFGGMPIQIGYVAGNPEKLNCLEYHKSSEFNIAYNDVILILGTVFEISGGLFDALKCKAFLVPSGVGVELYATTLHYAPFGTEDFPYKVVCVLPKGTNSDKPDFKAIGVEDKMCFGANKWLLAHSGSSEAGNGAYIGLIGENIKRVNLKVN